jgi:hypothetical protein
MNIDWTIVTALGGMVAALAAVAGTMITVFALIADHRRSRLTLQTELGFRIEESMDTDGMRALRRVAAEKLLTGVSENPELTRLLDYFSRTAWLVETGVLDLETTFIMQEVRCQGFLRSARQSAGVGAFEPLGSDLLLLLSARLLFSSPRTRSSPRGVGRVSGFPVRSARQSAAVGAFELLGSDQQRVLNVYSEGRAGRSGYTSSL